MLQNIWPILRAVPCKVMATFPKNWRATSIRSENNLPKR